LPCAEIKPRLANCHDEKLDQMYFVHGFLEAARFTRTRPVRDINVYCHLLLGTVKNTGNLNGRVRCANLLGFQRECGAKSPRLRRAPVPHPKLTTSQHQHLADAMPTSKTVHFQSFSTFPLF
jgi:hypothetical protein